MILNADKEFLAMKVGKAVLAANWQTLSEFKLYMLWCI